jgi:hypothetical protein
MIVLALRVVAALLVAIALVMTGRRLERAALLARLHTRRQQ